MPVDKYYKVKCPECYMPIKKVKNIKDIKLNEPIICYSCEKEIILSEYDVIPTFLPKAHFGVSKIETLD